VISEAEATIRAAIKEANQPALLYSGGKESSLLLAMLERIGDEARGVPLLCFYDEWPVAPARLSYVEKTFSAHSRVLLNYWPLYRFMVPTAEGIDLVNAYDLAGTPLPVLVSTADRGGKGLPCVLDWLRLPKKDCPDFCFDLLICGGRKEDTHPWFGSPYKLNEMKVGKAKLLLPLLDWSEVEVWEAIRGLDVPYDVDRYDFKGTEHLDEVEMCTRCVRARVDEVYCSKLDRMI